nr:MAG TPA: hypothetical protein [Caudoviricetes sp.]
MAKIFDPKTKLVCIGTVAQVRKETEKAILYQVGTSAMGLPIETYLPKSELFEKDGYFYIPLWLAKQKGMGWYLDNQEYNNTYKPNGFEKIFKDTKSYDDDDDDDYDTEDLYGYDAWMNEFFNG